MLEKILVPVDTIENSYTYEAVKKSIDFVKGWKKEPELVFFHVEYIESDLTEKESERILSAKEEEMEEEFKIIREECEKAGLTNVTTKFVEGKDYEEIVKMAEENFELIIMGSGKLHDRNVRGRIKKFLYGSVAEKVIHETPCSVLICRSENDE